MPRGFKKWRRQLARAKELRDRMPVPPPKRRRIARETLEIYAPIAHRLGMSSIRMELENLGFEALHPLRYKVLSRHLKKARGHQKQMVQKITTSLTQALERDGIEAAGAGREKHLYSI